MRKLLLLSLLVFPFSGKTQSIAAKVVASSGGNFSNSNLSVSWTVGELSIHYLTDNGYVISQGFQQPEYINVTNLRMAADESVIETTHESDFDIKLYPNPVANELFVVMREEDWVGISSVSLMNTTGIILEEKALRRKDRLGSGSFLMARYPSGLYFIKIAKKNGGIILRKIMKI